MQFTVSTDQSLIKPEAGRYSALIETVKLKNTKSGTPMLSVCFIIRLKPTGHEAKLWHTFFLSGMGSNKATEFVRAIKPDFRNGDPLSTEFLVDKRVEIDIGYNLNPKTEWEKDRPIVMNTYPLISEGDSFKVAADMFDSDTFSHTTLKDLPKEEQDVP